MKRIRKTKTYGAPGRRAALGALGAAVLLAACTDLLDTDATGPAATGEGIQFCVTTREMGDLTIGLGSTRAAGADADASGAGADADAFTARDMAGDNPYGLSLHRMPLPYVGIHRKAVRRGAATAGTRASVDDIVKADGSNFHDSLSIWGYTDKGKEPLFDQTLLKQIQDWRSAVLWPYDKTSPAEDRPQTMRFYAVAPSSENLNFSVLKPGELTGELLEGKWRDDPTTGGALKPDDYGGASYQYAPIFRLTLPETVDAMRDVLYGESEIISVQAGPSGSVTDNPEDENLGQDNKRVALSFRHILTAIRFAQGGTFPVGVTVERICLKGIEATGIFNPNRKDERTLTMGDWTIASGDHSAYDFELNGLSAGTEGSNTYIDGRQVMFMIPQTLGDGAELEVTLKAPQRYKTDADGNYLLNADGNREPCTSETKTMTTHTVSCSLGGDVWKKGYTVTYRLTVGELEDGYYLMVEPPAPLEHNSKGEMSGSFTVHSYHSYYNYSENPQGEEDVVGHGVDWTVAGYYTRKGNDDEIVVGGNSEEPQFETVSKPDWLSSIGGKELGDKSVVYEGGYVKPVEFKLAESEYASAGNHQTNLQKNTENYGRAIDEPLNSPESANCYIVNRAGTYTFPLVYGNKATYGVPEPAGIVDHRGRNITYRKIQDQLVNIYPGEYSWDNTQAVIVWQDVEKLITNVTKAGDIISFSISKDNIKPGNAVIALQAKRNDKPNGWETLWTWHIWVTDEVTPVTLENYEGESSKILPVNLGWVPDKDTYGVYEPREVWVKILQVESKGGTPASAMVRIRQEARQDSVIGTSTLYQWGRPTALPMTLSWDGTNTVRKIYNSEGTDISGSFVLMQASALSSGYHIANPTWMFRWSTDTDENKDGKSVWFDMDLVSVPEYWSAERKTVYDPCPPGYRVPPVRIFTGLSRTGTYSLYGSQLNVYPDVAYQDEKGEKGVASNAFRDAGAYFYARRFVSEQDMDANRYTYPLVYFPVTGEWQGDVPAETAMNGTYNNDKSLKTNNTFGFYWCADHDPADKINASTLWIHPEWDWNIPKPDENPNPDDKPKTEEKPAIQFGRTIQYSSAQPIRPYAP